jgi:CRISPR/Cas system-associated protein endoribonuclease Cas2
METGGKMRWFNFYIAAALDIVALYLFWISDASSLPGLVGIALHAAAVVFSFLFFKPLAPSISGIHPMQFPAMIVGICGAMPLIGLLAITYFGILFKPRPGLELEDKHIRVYAKGVHQVHIENLKKHRIPDPIVKVLALPEEERRRNAILTLEFVNKAKAVNILKRVVLDSDEYTRINAQSVLHRWASQIESNIKSIENKLQNKKARIPELVNLMDLYYQFAEMKLNEAEVNMNQIRRAEEIGEQILKGDPGNHPARLLLLKCQLKTGNIAGAQENLRFLREAPGFQSLILPAEMEIAYITRNFKRLKATLSQISRDRILGAQYAKHIKYWIDKDVREVAHA